MSVTGAEEGMASALSQQAINPIPTHLEKRKYEGSDMSKEGFSNEAPFLPLKRPRHQRIDNELKSPVKTSRTLKLIKEFLDFALPHPCDLGLLEELRDLALNWEQAFKMFDDRDFSTIQESIFDLNQAFKAFKAHEERTWTEISQRVGDHEYFVQPSGLLNSPLAHRLHQPSMTTSKQDGTTAYRSNGCIRMIMDNGYKQGESLLFDQFHRRSDKSDGVERCPYEILQCHEGFTRQIYESMTSPLVIIYGRKVQERVLNHMQIEHTVFPLWDRAEGVSLVLFHEKSFGNAEPGHRIRRIGLCAAHPQHLFYAKQRSLVTEKQHKVIDIAVEMISGAVPAIAKYDSEKKWLIKNVTILKSFAQIDTGAALDEMSSVQNPLVSTNTAGPKSTSPFLEFSERPYSVKTLQYEIRPSAIRAQQSDNSEWEAFSDIPADVQRWLQGVKQSVFPDFEIKELGDISKSLDRILSKLDGCGHGDLSNENAILELMLAQQK